MCEIKVPDLGTGHGSGTYSTRRDTDTTTENVILPLVLGCIIHIGYSYPSHLPRGNWRMRNRIGRKCDAVPYAQFPHELRDVAFDCANFNA